MELNIRLQYPMNDEFEFRTRLIRINPDEEMENDIANNKGFFIKEPPPLDKALKRTDTIYSEKYMKTIRDPDAYMDRYSCKCGATQGRDYRNSTCKHCGTIVKFVGDDFEIFGYIHLKKPYPIIHPNLFKTIAAYFGASTFDNIIEPEMELDENGNPVGLYSKRIAKKKAKRKYSKRPQKVDETFAGIGMTAFYHRFDEILEYFHEKNKNKKIEYYNDIKANRDIIFIHSIPVYSTGLRPFKTEGKRFTFEGTNAIFNMLAKLVANINEDDLSMFNIRQYRDSLLWDVQERYNKLYSEIENILSKKKGSIRMLIGGRCGFTSRLVIVPQPDLKIDEVSMSYYSLVELLQQTIINVLVKSYSISYADAYMRWFKSQLVPDERVKQIIQNIIDIDGGINVLVNRNQWVRYHGNMVQKLPLELSGKC